MDENPYKSPEISGTMPRRRKWKYLILGLLGLLLVGIAKGIYDIDSQITVKRQMIEDAELQKPAHP